ncbi:hemagglutinin/amebocyte aggregation factor-like [Ostrea edulis]|uniref:hemagglutinin/amebocyte aggregation factor-like n=1 Tax=Ostrea edulis TaxID=37623 RepID=UPI0024AFB30F|nr:hemagglutinin/amebocyte aggregation factor-like [Ostrea edulis]XP_056015802.1 hemagglutinin/amebocyte aggregation factor-like [Ostrea edulis]
MKTLVFALLTVTFIGMSDQWKNQWDKPLNFQCPSSLSAITHIVSTHSNGKEDRRFNFDCTRVQGVSGPRSCKLSGYVNDWDRDILYTCPDGGYLNGISSVHNNKKEDRRYRFRCCTPKGRYYHKFCRWTGWVNNWDATFSYFVPRNYVIRGINSIHSNSKEDRRFKFEVCRVLKH